jgi:type VI secretion system protein ImpE
MDPIELIRANRLSDARSRLVEEVKAAPGDGKSRTLLFQVLSFLGEWDKAGRHLDILALGNPATKTGGLVFQDLIAAERVREKVVRGDGLPDFLTDTPPFLENLLAARGRSRAGCADEALALLEKAHGKMPMISGVVDGRDFTGFRNVDPFLGGFIEAFVHDRYLWIGFDSLRELTVQEPKTFLDLLWIPASLTTWDGLTTGCYLPVTYPGSAGHGDELVCLGKKTVWEDLGSGLCRGAGQHVFDIGDTETGLLEIREVRFTPAG